VEVQQMTWEQKVESLVKLAKAAGRFINATPGTDDYHNDARRSMFEAYEEPYVVDEVNALLGKHHEGV